VARAPELGRRSGPKVVYRGPITSELSGFFGPGEPPL
jgi:hypothetical protein